MGEGTNLENKNCQGGGKKREDWNCEEVLGKEPRRDKSRGKETGKEQNSNRAAHQQYKRDQMTVLIRPPAALWDAANPGNTTLKWSIPERSSGSPTGSKTLVKSDINLFLTKSGNTFWFIFGKGNIYWQILLLSSCTSYIVNWLWKTCQIWQCSCHGKIIFTVKVKSNFVFTSSHQ